MAPDGNTPAMAAELDEQDGPSLHDCVAYFARHVARTEARAAAHALLQELLAPMGFKVPPLPPEQDED